MRPQLMPGSFATLGRALEPIRSALGAKTGDQRQLWRQHSGTEGIVQSPSPSCTANLRQVTTAASAQPLLATTASDASEPEPNQPNQPQQQRTTLNWEPTLTAMQEVACFLASCLICGLSYVLTAPPSLSLSYAAGMAVLCAVLVWALRNVLLERQYEARSRLFSELGDPDSRFPRVGQLQVHAKAYASRHLLERLAAAMQQTTQAATTAAAPTTTAAGAATALTADSRSSAGTPAGRQLEVVAAHCYHGFGANLYSYKPVQASLARALDGVVTAHDMPGFGLTERPSNTSSYFLSYNGQLGSQLVDYEVQRLLEEATPTNTPKAAGSPPVTMAGGSQGMFKGGVQGAGVEEEDIGLELERVKEASRSASLSSQSSAAPTTTTSPCLLVKKVLVGHSLGGICAALAALDQPEQVAALVLVAPAILALPDKQAPLAELQPQPQASGTGAAAVHGWGGAVSAAPRSHPITLDEGDEGEVAARARDGAGKGAAAAEQAAGADDGNGGGWAPGRIPAGLVDRYTCPADAVAATKTGKVAGAPGAAVTGSLGARLVRVACVLGQALLLLGALLLLVCLKPAIVAVLRVLVRSRAFWLKGLQQAYFNPDRVTDEVVDAYRLPQLVRGWESGMFMFLTARLAGTVDLKVVGERVAGLMSSVEQGVAEDAGLAKRLGGLVRQHHTPVLIIHGVHDKLVPASNSQRLAAMLPGCELALVQRCGHMPQEEWPQPFVELVREFVQRRGKGGKGEQVPLPLAPA